MTAPVSAPVYTVPFLLFPAAAAPAEKALRKLSAEQAYPIMYSPQPAAFITADAMTSSCPCRRSSRRGLAVKGTAVRR